MRKWIDITEAYLTTAVVGNVSSEVFKDPSRKEAMALIRASDYGWIRGVIHSLDGPLYVWSAEGDAEMIEHRDIEEKLGDMDLRLFLSKDTVTVYSEDAAELSEDSFALIAAHPSIRRIYGKDVTVKPY